MKKFKALFIMAIFLFITFYVPQTSVVVSAANDRVTLFRHGDYSGESVELPSGNYSCDQFRYVGDNQLSSLRIPSGMVISVFDNSNFTGDMRTYTTDTPSMSDFNDRTSSVRVGKTGSLTTVYEHGFYGGRSMTLLPGGYTVWQLMAAVGNDTISCVVVPDGYRVYLYEHENFGGRAYVFERGGVSNYFGEFNDRTSSISIVPIFSNNGSSVILYNSSITCSSPRVALGVGNYKFDQFTTVGNNEIGVIEIPNDMVVYVYDNDDFTGDMRIYEKTDIMNNFYKKISSVRIVKKSDLITVYQHCDFVGKKMNLIPGSYSCQQLTAQVGNDTISSVRIPSGYRVYLYEHDWFGGRVRVCTGTESFLSDFNDKTSSIIVSTV